VEEKEINNDNVNVLELDTEEQTKWAHEQNVLGIPQRELAEKLNVNVNTLKSRITTYRKTHGIEVTNKNMKRPNKNTGVQKSTNENSNTGQMKTNSPKSTQSNSNEPAFTESEIKTLKEIIKERESNKELLNEFMIYKELSKVPTDAETIRSAFNMSKETTERLKKYANERRLPLQDIVELAVINLLDKYGAK
jgi:hypothetical protein